MYCRPLLAFHKMHNKLYNADHKERLSYAYWYLQWSAWKRNRPLHSFWLVEKLGFNSADKQKSQNIMFLMLIREVPLHGIKAGVWYVECNRINALIFLRHIDTLQIFWHHFLTHVDYERAHAFLQQESASAHTKNNNYMFLECIFGDRIGSRGMASSFARSEPVKLIFICVAC